MIHFPKLHIATSVVNRILNIADGIPDQAPPVLPGPAGPNVPDPRLQSYQLDQALAQAPPQNVPGLNQAPDPGALASGDPLLDTMLKPGGTP